MTGHCDDGGLSRVSRHELRTATAVRRFSLRGLQPRVQAFRRSGHSTPASAYSEHFRALHSASQTCTNKPAPCKASDVNLANRPPRAERTAPPLPAPRTRWCSANAGPAASEAFPVVVAIWLVRRAGRGRCRFQAEGRCRSTWSGPWPWPGACQRWQPWPPADSLKTDTASTRSCAGLRRLLAN